MKCKLKYIMLVLFLVIPFYLSASTTGDISTDEYIIGGYDIDIIVNEDNTFDITENITANFFVDKHGIYRNIPFVNKVYRLDGSTSINYAKIKNISVNEKYSIKKNNSNYVIKIGNQFSYVNGEKKYVIKYTYDIGNDTLKDKDELYLNIIGGGWDTSISNITFRITMPKDFDSSKLGFSSGSYGSTDSSNINYKVNGNVITGSYNGYINPGEYLTVRCELPEGYFVKSINIYKYVIFIVSLICLLISYIIWKKYGKDNMVIETTEFYPPEGLNSLDLGFIYKGKALNSDVTSLLVYLANKGYIKIVEESEIALLSKVYKYEFIKLKDYDGNDENEKMFLEGLFENAKVSDNNEVKITSYELSGKFYTITNKILKNVNKKENKNKIFEVNKPKRLVLIILFVILLLTVLIGPTYYYGGISDLGGLLFVLLFVSPFYIAEFKINSSIFQKLFILLFPTIIFIVGVFNTNFINYIVLNDLSYIIYFVISFICLVITGILILSMRKRTKYGNEMLGKIRGFKNFLETVEKDKLESLVNENHSLFYDILPYTYVLGVSSIWIKKFSNILFEKPDWYVGDGNFTPDSFNRFMTTSMNNLNRTLSSNSSSSSGSSSGGGFSGGGSGGGGGGSW